MAGEKKNIADMSDEDIEGLSADELLELQTGAASEEDEEEEEGDESDDSDADEGDGEDEEEADGDEDEESEDDEDADPQLTKEQLEALAAEEDEDGDPDDTSDMVPRSRLNAEIEKGKDKSLVIRALLRSGAGTPAPAAAKDPDPEPEPEFLKYDFKAKGREVIKLIAEGDEDRASALQDEIEDTRAKVNQYNLDKARAEATAQATGEFQAQRARDALDATVADVYERYPMLNNQSKHRNEAAILAVNGKTKELMAKGKPAHLALAEAADKMMKILGLATDKTPAKQGKNDKVAKVDGDKKVDKTPAKDGRTKEALKRNLAIRQPAQQKNGVGTRDRLRTIDIRNMTDAQIDALEKNDPAAYAELIGAGAPAE